MNILTLTMDFLPMSGGLARFADSLARVFANDMTVIADVEAPALECRAVQKHTPYCLRYQSFMRPGFPRWRGAFGVLRKERPDMVVVHHVLPLGFVARVFRKVTGTPYIVCLHGMDFATAVRRPWKRWLLRRVLRGAHTVVANSQFLASAVHAQTGKTAIVCYPTPWIRPESLVTRERTGGHVVLTSVARLVERKGIQRVLRALANMPDMHDTIRYHIAGVGPYAAEIRALISKHHLSHVVSLTENDSQECLTHAYAQADVFVLPTLSSDGDREGFGIVYLEAALFGAPSIASWEPGVDEAVLDGETGVLVSDDTELERAMRRLVGDGVLRKTLGDAARERAKHFTPEIQFQELKKRLYD